MLLASRYHDDEPGSPWSFYLYVDERGSEPQRDALEQIFLGRLGGTPQKQFPWVWKPSDVLGVRAVGIEIDHTPGRGWFRAGGHVSVRVRGTLEGNATVTCVIPGHSREGRELHADEIAVSEERLNFELTGSCGYESTFDYASDTDVALPHPES